MRMGVVWWWVQSILTQKSKEEAAKACISYGITKKKLGKIIIINKYKWGNIIFFKAREKNAIHTETRDSLHEFQIY